MRRHFGDLAPAVHSPPTPPSRRDRSATASALHRHHRPPPPSRARCRLRGSPRPVSPLRQPTCASLRLDAGSPHPAPYPAPGGDGERWRPSHSERWGAQNGDDLYCRILDRLNPEPTCYGGVRPPVSRLRRRDRLEARSRCGPSDHGVGLIRRGRSGLWPHSAPALRRRTRPPRAPDSSTHESAVRMLYSPRAESLRGAEDPHHARGAFLRLVMQDFFGVRRYRE